MSELSNESIHTLSILCRIELTPEEEAAISHDLNHILDHVKKLKEVDVNHLSPYSHDDEQGIESLRDDTVGEQLSRETFLSNAPDQVGGMIRVPPIIKQNP